MRVDIIVLSHVKKHTQGVEVLSSYFWYSCHVGVVFISGNYDAQVRVTGRRR